MTPRKGFISRDIHLLDSEMIDAVEQAIIMRFEEITDLAFAGKPPALALLPDLDGVIIEAAYWRLADNSIGHALSPRFERVGRVSVPIPLLRRAAVYEACGAT